VRACMAGLRQARAACARVKWSKRGVVAKGTALQAKRQRMRVRAPLPHIISPKRKRPGLLLEVGEPPCSISARRRRSIPARADGSMHAWLAHLSE
jgi:hypothetical protein